MKGLDMRQAKLVAYYSTHLLTCSVTREKRTKNVTVPEYDDYYQVTPYSPRYAVLQVLGTACSSDISPTRGMGTSLRQRRISIVVTDHGMFGARVGT